MYFWSPQTWGSGVVHVVSRVGAAGPACGFPRRGSERQMSCMHTGLTHASSSRRHTTPCLQTVQSSHPHPEESLPTATDEGNPPGPPLTHRWPVQYLWPLHVTQEQPVRVLAWPRSPAQRAARASATWICNGILKSH